MIINLTPHAHEPKIASIDVAGLTAQVHGLNVALTGVREQEFTGTSSLRVVANNGTETSVDLGITFKEVPDLYPELMQELGAAGYWPLDEESGLVGRNLGTAGSGANAAFSNFGVSYRRPRLRLGGKGSIMFSTVNAVQAQGTITNLAVLNQVFRQGGGGSVVLWYRNVPRTGVAAANIMPFYCASRVSAGPTSATWPNGRNEVAIPAGSEGFKTQVPQMLVLVFDPVAQRVRMHMNGVRTTSAGSWFDSSVASGAQPFSFPFGTYSAFVEMSDLALFPRVLTTSEVARIYEYHL